MSERSHLLFEGAFLLACLLAAGALVGPVWRGEREREARSRAEKDCLRIAGALRRYLADLGGPPRDPRTLAPFAWLYGPGLLPRGGAGFRCGPGAALEAVLCQPDPLRGGWRGPYLEWVGADPWGHAYLVHLRGLTVPEEVPWILSAGPDGVLTTGPTSRRLHGDDVGVILRPPQRP